MDEIYGRDEIYEYALKLLSRRDYTAADLRRRLEVKFGKAPQAALDAMIQKGYLDDRRFARNFIARRPAMSRDRLREELIERGTPEDIAAEELAKSDSPSLRDVLKAKMTGWNLRAPLEKRDAGRLFRALQRLGFPADAIQEELEQLHEQQ